MQTFVPYDDNTQNALSLDNKRLGKQRVEGWQILSALGYLQMGSLYTIGKNGKLRKRGWLNHPAVLMWEGHEWWLCLYCEAICKEWIARGYKDTMLSRFQKWRAYNPQANPLPPSWWGEDEFHQSHRSRLISKDSEHYAPQFPDTPLGLDYVWTSSSELSTSLRAS